MEEVVKCDMCGTKIENGTCGCGYWRAVDESKEHPFKIALDEFHEMKRFTLTCDVPHIGCAVVFFRGDYNDTKEVEKFIHKMKGRPYYNEMD